MISAIMIVGKRTLRYFMLIQMLLHLVNTTYLHISNINFIKVFPIQTQTTGIPSLYHKKHCRLHIRSWLQ